MNGQSAHNFLAIDTAAGVFSAALSRGQAVWYFEADAGAIHSQMLMDIVDILCKKAELAPADLSAVFCMRGPGSFTGLRIGFAGAKGLALALNIPFVSVPTLDCMAFSFSIWPGIVVPVIDAKKSAYFFALYQNGIRRSDDFDAGVQTLENQIAGLPNGETEQILLTGPDAEKLYGEIPESSPVFRGARLAPSRRGGYAKDLLALAQNMPFNAGEENAGPVYIRKSDAELNAEKRRENVR